MKILYYDCFSGISGDMNIGAMIDLGVDKEYLLKELNKLNISDEFEIKISKDSRKGICGTKFDVILKSHEHHDENEHHHEDGHHHGRNIKDIYSIINSSTLNENIKKISMDIFMKVAEAESKVHGKPMDEVHFHEVGAVDSIVDIVGAAICMDYLKPDIVISSRVELGGGFVKCAHGIIPVPAPATCEILKNIPVTSGRVLYETTTPTGAAILKTFCSRYSDNKNFSIKKVGYGIGTRDTDISNVLRVFIGESEEHKKDDEVYVLETNIDDMNPEIYGYIYDKLFEKGALDVFMTQIIMKKERPGIKLTVICRRDDIKAVQEFILKETTTMGVRKYKTVRAILDRKINSVKTKYGDIKVKEGCYGGKVIKSKPEYDDCRKAADKYNVSIKDVYSEVNRME